MSLGDLKNIVRFMGARKPSEQEKRQLFKEVALMVLARATSADTNIKRIEVETVQAILKRVTGEEVGRPDIQLAAKSDLFEKKPLDRYLAGVGRKLDASERATILSCLAEVIRSDERISHFETDYFDMVAKALRATPSEVAGLRAQAITVSVGGPGPGSRGA